MFKNFDWRHALALVACGIVLGIGQIPQVKSFDAILYGVASPLFLYAGMALPQIGGAAKKLGAVLLLVALAHSTTACLAATPQVPITPANQSQVSSCSNTAAWHNGFIVGDFVVGGLGGAAGVAGSLVTDNGQKTGLAVAAGVAGALTAAGAAVAGYTANKYVSDACPTLTGPLPLGHAKAAGGLR